MENPEQFGIVGVNAEGRIYRFKEKPRTEEVFSRVINAGTYVLEREVLDLIPEGRKYDFSKNLFMDMLDKGRGLFATPLVGYWKDIGRPSDLYLANLDMAIRRGGTPAPEGAIAEPPYHFGEGVGAQGARVHRSVVGRGCRLGQGSAVEGSLLLDEVVVGEGALVQGCILGEGCVVGAGAVLVDCVLGDRARAPPLSWTKAANIEPGASI